MRETPAIIYVTTRDVAALITIGTRDPALRTPGNLLRQGAKSGLHKRKMRAETRSCEVGPAEKFEGVHHGVLGPNDDALAPRLSPAIRR